MCFRSWTEKFRCKNRTGEMASIRVSEYCGNLLPKRRLKSKQRFVVWQTFVATHSNQFDGGNETEIGNSCFENGRDSMDDAPNQSRPGLQRKIHFQYVRYALPSLCTCIVAQTKLIFRKGDRNQIYLFHFCPSRSSTEQWGSVQRKSRTFSLFQYKIQTF